MRRVCSIFTKISFAEDFMEWSGQLRLSVAWIYGLLILRPSTNRTNLERNIGYGCILFNLTCTCCIFTKTWLIKGFMYIV